MNRINRKITTALIASTAIMIITGGAVTYGFQGILAALGLLFLLASAGAGIYIMRKARLYAKIVQQAKWINNIEVIPVSTNDKNWIMKHLDNLFNEENEVALSISTSITKTEKKGIMNHLDEFMMKIRIDNNTVTWEDQQFIMENIDRLFEDNREEDRQSFSW